MEKRSDDHDPDRMLSVEDAAHLLGVSRSFIYQRTRRNTIPLHRLGGTIRFARHELLAWATGKTETEGNEAA